MKHVIQLVSLIFFFLRQEFIDLRDTILWYVIQEDDM
jgi:hypothetical protein